jgi:hypothetical protein
LTTLAFGAVAAPKDNAATTKIEEAINVHYLATDFVKAEGQLLGVVKACGKDGCSPNIVARAWMYVGLVRGSGKQDLPGAREAFAKAKEIDGNVTLDTALATPEVQSEFDAIVGKGGAPAAASDAEPGPTGEASGVAAASAVAASVGECTPAPGGEIEIRRPIPISCKVPEGVVKAILSYKEFGGTQFVNVPMTLKNGSVQAPVPCSATKMEGALQYLVIMKDTAGATVATVGSLEQPAQLNIVKTTVQPPPAFPGEAPPARCAEEVECPPGMPGCTPSGGGGWGDSCTPAESCKKGLYCDSGTCQNAPSCETDSDCDSGRCSEGFCEMEEGSSSSSGGAKIRKLWLGLHAAADVHFFGSGKNVCSVGSMGNHKYSCYYGGTTVPIQDGYAGAPYNIPTDKGSMGTINGGAKIATIRLLLSADYAVIPNLTVGGRVGFAFNGGPKQGDYGDPENDGTYTAKKGKAFMPLHLEARVAYWFRSFGQPGLRPYIAVGGGIAQVDAKISVPIAAPDASGQTVMAKADVYKRLGQGFITLAPGVMIPIGSRLGALVNVNAMYMLPDSGFVLEPSLGMVMGF